MKSIKIKATGKYLPKSKTSSEELSKIIGVTKEFITSRTGIETRYYAKTETITEMAINAVDDLILNSKINKETIEMIIVATTSSKKLMPGISYEIQKIFGITNCFCLDILAGCAGFINAFDIARLYIASGKCKNALIIGVDKLSEYTNKEDVGTAVVLSDGAGAVFIEVSDEEKIYSSNIISDGKRSEILTLNTDSNIYMNGKEIYRYAVTDTISNLNTILQKNEIKLEEIDYIVPHQANTRILDAISLRLNIDNNKLYKNIMKVGNTFCASIPIALSDMNQQGLLRKKQKIILLGFGGGLNTGSILLEV